MKDFFGLIIGIIIACVVMHLINFLSEKEYEDELTQPDEIEFIKKDALLDAYIPYFRSTVGNPYNNFIIQKKLYKEIRRDFKNTVVIKQLINQILIHLNLPIVDFKVNLDKRNGEIAGQYFPSPFNPIINIYIKDNSTVQNIIAVICHECTHHFMHIHNINSNSNNETLTDALAIYLGFGKYIRAGYAQQKRIVNKQYDFIDYNTTSVKYQVESSSIGYLNQSQIEYMLIKIRKIKHKRYWHRLLNKINLIGKVKNYIKNYRIRKIESLKSEFINNYDKYMEIIQRNNEIVDILSSKRINVMSPSDITLIQNCIYDINSGTYYYHAKLLKNNVLNSNTSKKEINLSIKKLSEQSSHLTSINTKLSKYL